MDNFSLEKFASSMTTEHLKKNAWLVLAATAHALYSRNIYSFQVDPEFEPRLYISWMCILGANVLITVLAAMLVAASAPDIRTWFRRHGKAVKAASLLAAAGTSVSQFRTAMDMTGHAGMPYAASAIYCAVLCAACAPFLAAYACWFWDAMSGTIRSIWKSMAIEKRELYAYAAILTAMTALSLYMNIRTDAFNNPVSCDIIYTLDSADLAENGAIATFAAYAAPLHQIFWAMFAMPSAGPFYLAGTALDLAGLPAVWAMLPWNVLIIIACHAVLGSAIGLKGSKRTVFVLASCATWPSIMHAICLEQYAMSLLFLACIVYLAAQGKRSPRMLQLAAYGSMMASMSMWPIASRIKDRKHSDVIENIKSSAGLAAILVCFRAAVSTFMHSVSSMLTNMSFVTLGSVHNTLTQQAATRPVVTASGKLMLCLDAIPGCFRAPKHAVYHDAVGLLDGNPITTVVTKLPQAINMAGIAILAMTVLALAILHKKPYAKPVAWWLSFTVIATAVVGYGANENGLHLYALYLGWPFIASLAALADEVSKKLKAGWIFYAAALVLIAAVMPDNLRGLRDLLEFGLAYYPRA